ncbi:hypothetical protein F5141DRAFT_1238580 [Pisolithus sp. B1]|nr:hypothetical protein F5141DRAFT_1238580 [Pisolithus sp. B1]
MATETGQDTHNSDDESRDLPGSQNEPTDSPSDCAETEAGHVKPEPEVIDAWHLKPYLRGVEVEAIDSKQLEEGMNALEAPDEGCQCAGNKAGEDKDLPTSSDTLETPRDLPSTTSERAETRTGHTKPEDEVVDTWHMVDVLPMFEVGSTGQAWYSKHVKDLQASDKGGWRASDEVEESQDLLKSSSEVLKPMSIEDSQHAWMNSETIANVPDPPSTPTKHPTPQVESSMLQKWPSAQACSATTTKFGLSYMRRSGKRRAMQHLKLDCRRALRHPKRTYQGHSTSKTPPDEARGKGVPSSPRVGWGDSTMTGSIMMTLEIRGISANTVETRGSLPHAEMHLKELDKGEISSGYNHAISRDSVNLHSIAQALPNLPHMGTHPKDPDKAGDTSGGGDDAASKEFVNSHGVKKTLLANSRSQQGELKVRRQNGLPAPPDMPPNGCMYPPGTIRDPRRRGRMKTRAENVSNTRTRQNAYITHAALKWPPPLLFASSKRFMDPTGGLWITRIGCSEVRSTRKSETRGHTHQTAGIYMQLPQGLSNPLRRLRNITNTYWQKGVSPGLAWNDATRPRNLRTAKRLPRSSGTRRDNKFRAKQPNDSPAPSKRARSDLAHTPWTLRDSCRCATIKTRSKNISTIETRGSKASRPTTSFSLPRHLAKFPWNISNTYWRHGIPPGRTRNIETPLLFNTAAWRQRYKARRRAHTMRIPKREVATMQRRVNTATRTLLTYTDSKLTSSRIHTHLLNY